METACVTTRAPWRVRHPARPPRPTAHWAAISSVSACPTPADAAPPSTRNATSPAVRLHAHSTSTHGSSRPYAGSRSVSASGTRSSGAEVRTGSLSAAAQAAASTKVIAGIREVGLVLALVLAWEFGLALAASVCTSGDGPNNGQRRCSMARNSPPHADGRRERCRATRSTVAAST